MKHYIYRLRKDEKEFNKKEFLTEIKVSRLTDKINEHIYQTKYKDKWIYIKLLLW